jgi:hypothetical protein
MAVKSDGACDITGDRDENIAHGVVESRDVV